MASETGFASASQMRWSPMIKPFGAATSFYTLCWRWQLTSFRNGKPYGVAELGLGLNHRDAIVYASSGIHLTRQYSLFATVSNAGVDIKWNIKLFEGLECGIIYSNFDLIKPVITYHFIPREVINWTTKFLRCLKILPDKPKRCTCKCTCNKEKPLCHMKDISELPFFVTLGWDTNTAPYIGFGFHI